MNAKLAQELAAMAAEDQKMRTETTKNAEGGLVHRMSVEERMRWSRCDVANSDRLREIMEEYGWPGESLVGVDGVRDAWLLAQHADHDLSTQRRALELLSHAVADGEASVRHEAYLIDRVRINEGREQLYGTQMAGFSDRLGVPWPIEDAGNLDRRRASVGLEPFAEYAKSFGTPLAGDGSDYS
jgi:hypothetical protein